MTLILELDLGIRKMCNLAAKMTKMEVQGQGSKS